MSTQAFLLCSTSGRLRFRIPSRKGDAAFFDSLRITCANLPDITGVAVSALTSTLLVTFEPSTGFTPGEIAERLDLNIQAICPKSWEKSISNQFGFLDREFRRLTGGELDLRGAAFLGCLAAGVYQIAAGNIAMPAWFVAFWYAMNLAGNAKSPEINPCNLVTGGESND